MNFRKKQFQSPFTEWTTDKQPSTLGKMIGKTKKLEETDSWLRHALKRGGEPQPQSSCAGFDPDTATAYIEKKLSASERHNYEIHLDRCPPCRASVACLVKLIFQDDEREMALATATTSRIRLIVSYFRLTPEALSLRSIASLFGLTPEALPMWNHLKWALPATLALLVTASAVIVWQTSKPMPNEAILSREDSSASPSSSPGLLAPDEQRKSSPEPEQSQAYQERQRTVSPSVSTQGESPSAAPARHSDEANKMADKAAGRGTVGKLQTEASQENRPGELQINRPEYISTKPQPTPQPSAVKPEGAAIGQDATAGAQKGALARTPEGAAVVQGVVTDQRGAAIAGAQIALTNSLTGQSQNTVADAKGFFQFAPVPAGDYKLTAQSQGFKSYEQENIKAEASQTVNTQVQLQVGTVSETVAVTQPKSPPSQPAQLERRSEIAKGQGSKEAREQTRQQPTPRSRTALQVQSDPSPAGSLVKRGDETGVRTEIGRDETKPKKSMDADAISDAPIKRESAGAAKIEIPPLVSRRVQGRTFYFKRGVWIDAVYADDSHLPVIKLKHNSEEYKRILKENPRLKPFFKLGKNVIVVFEKKIYIVSEK